MHHLAFASPSRLDTSFPCLLVFQYLLQHCDFRPELLWFWTQRPHMTCPCHAEISPCGQPAFGVSDTWSVGLCSSLNDQAVVSELSFSPQLTWHNTLPPFLIQLAALLVFCFLPMTSFPLSCLIFSYPWTVKQWPPSLQRH